MLGKNNTSLKQHAFRYSLVIFIVIFIAAVLHYLVFGSYLHSLDQKEQQKALLNVASNVSRTIGFYQTLTDQVSEQPMVQALIEFESDEVVQRWANNMRRMVPDSIGFTVFKDDGQVRGLHDQLRLGEACYRDMDRRLKGEEVSSPAVHRGIKGLEHFDVISDVELEGERIGIAFSSFSLDVLSRALDDMSSDTRAYRLIDNTGQVVAASQHIALASSSYQTIRQSVAGTDWQLEMINLGPKQNILATSLLVSNFITFILVSVILYFAMSRLINLVLSDFETVSTIMAKIKSGRFNLNKDVKPRLMETTGIIHFMNYTAQELDNYQKKLEHDSNTDELTGLYNRRVLNLKLDELLLPGKDQGQYHLLIIDIDFFKQVNDTYGHDVGDQVLLMFSDALRQFTSADDVCTRAGGDEFIVILKGYTMEQICEWHDSLRIHMSRQIEEYNIEQKLQVKFGLSAGCTLIRNNDIKGAVLKRADEALYNVKMAGRNNIECV